MNERSDQKLYDVIALGGMGTGLSNLMPPWGRTLREEEIWDLVNYIRSLAEPPYIPHEIREKEKDEKPAPPEEEEGEEEIF
jgi:mono/diheme cytochrome c family protein